MRAYETTSDPAQREIYDLKWENIRSRANAQREAKKRAEEAADTGRKENLNRQREQKARQGRLEQFYQEKSRLDRDIFEINRVVTRLTTELKRLQEQDDEEERKARANDSWWKFVTSPIYGKTKESDEEKQRREFDRLQRLTSQRVKEFDLDLKGARLKELTSSLQDVEKKIAAEKRKTEDEARAQEYQRQEQLRQEQEVRRRQEEQRAREIRAAWERAEAERQRQDTQRAEEAARKMREAREERIRKQKEQEAREEIERRERAEEAEWRAEAARKRREQQVQEYKERCEREDAVRKAEAARAARLKHRSRSGTQKSKPTSNFPKQEPCQHRAFWPKLEGSYTCSECREVQRRFVFQCPGCDMIACANCRQELRGQTAKSHTSSKRPPPHRQPFSGYEWD